MKKLQHIFPKRQGHSLRYYCRSCAWIISLVYWNASSISASNNSTPPVVPPPSSFISDNQTNMTMTNGQPSQAAQKMTSSSFGVSTPQIKTNPDARLLPPSVESPLLATQENVSAQNIVAPSLPSSASVIPSAFANSTNNNPMASRNSSMTAPKSDLPQAFISNVASPSAASAESTSPSVSPQMLSSSVSASPATISMTPQESVNAQSPLSNNTALPQKKEEIDLFLQDNNPSQERSAFGQNVETEKRELPIFAISQVDLTHNNSNLTPQEQSLTFGRPAPLVSLSQPTFSPEQTMESITQNDQLPIIGVGGITAGVNAQQVAVNGQVFTPIIPLPDEAPSPTPAPLPAVEEKVIEQVSEVSPKVASGKKRIITRVIPDPEDPSMEIVEEIEVEESVPETAAPSIQEVPVTPTQPAPSTSSNVSTVQTIASSIANVAALASSISAVINPSSANNTLASAQGTAAPSSTQSPQIVETPAAIEASSDQSSSLPEGKIENLQLLDVEKNNNKGAYRAVIKKMIAEEVDTKVQEAVQVEFEKRFGGSQKEDAMKSQNSSASQSETPKASSSEGAKEASVVASVAPSSTLAPIVSGNPPAPIAPQEQFIVIGPAR